MFKDIFYSTRFRFSQFDSDFVPLSIIPYDFHIHFLEFMHLMSLLFKPWKPGTTILNRLIFSFLLLDFPQPKTVGTTISWSYKYERECLTAFIFEYNDIIYCVNHICHAWSIMTRNDLQPYEDMVNVTVSGTRDSSILFLYIQRNYSSIKWNEHTKNVWKN